MNSETSPQETAPKEPSSGQNVARTYRRARLAFLVLFIISTLVVIWLCASARRTTQGPAEVFATDLGSAVAFIAVATSVASLLGTITTTILAWRKDRRDTAAAELERERQRLEIEQLKRQLARQKNDGDSLG